MPERPTAVLRVQPHMIPALAAAYARAADDMRRLLVDLRVRGRIPEPWARDPVSVGIWQYYNEKIMDGPNSAFAALQLYLDELLKIVETLRTMEAGYRRTDGDDATRWGRL